MAASFWSSSQRKTWLFTQMQLDELIRAQKENCVLTSLERKHVMIYYTGMIISLAKALKLRQQIVSTACVFFKRYYLRHSLVPQRNNGIEPTLMLATCVYLACKVEEAPVHIKSVSQVMTSNQMLGSQSSIDPSKISECEFYLMEGLEFYMIVFHPYNAVIMYIKDLSLSKQDRTVFLQTAWMIVNDTYKTDLPMLYPPHMIALAVIYLTAGMQENALKDVDFAAWFSRFNVGHNDVLILVQHLLDMYQVMSLYVEKDVSGLVSRLRTAQV